MLRQTPLIMHIGAEPCSGHTAQPLPLVQTCRRGEVHQDILDGPFPAQRGVLPLIPGDASEVLGQCQAFLMHQGPEMFVSVLRHFRAFFYPRQPPPWESAEPRMAPVGGGSGVTTDISLTIR